MVNIIKFQFKKSILSLIVWLSIAILLSIVYVSIYPTFRDAAGELEALLSTYPPAMLESMNIDLANIAAIEGYYPMVIGFISLVSFAFAATNTLKVFCMEYKNKSVEFLMAKPRTRTTFFNAKMLTVLLLNTTYFVLLSIFNYLLINVLTDMTIKNFMLLQSSIFIIMILSTFLTSVLAVRFSKIRGYDGVGFIIAFGFYAISILSAVLDDVKLAYISIYGMFDFNEILSDGYNITTLAILALICIGLYVVSLTIYKRKDVL